MIHFRKLTIAGTVKVGDAVAYQFLKTMNMDNYRDMQTHPVVPAEDEVQLSVPIESSSEPAPNAEAVEDAEERYGS